MTVDPFRITGPTIISVSGGRTSAKMLRRHLDAHGGELPPDAYAVFTNTGREMPATLDFVRDLTVHWGVPITWLEYRRESMSLDEAAIWRVEQASRIRARIARLEAAPLSSELLDDEDADEWFPIEEQAARVANAEAERADAVRKLQARLDSLHMFIPARRQWAEVVGHNSASRRGEPFRAMLEGRGMLPNPVARFCTVELKIRTVYRWVRESLGWDHWTNSVGIRADEGHRIARAAKHEGKTRWTNWHPMADAGLMKPDVLKFWKAQPFDLKLAGEWEGNCDGCFMKGEKSIARMWQDHPERMEDWAEDEENALAAGRTVKPEMSLYRADRPSYRELGREAAAQPRFAFSWLEGALPCTGGGCGV